MARERGQIHGGRLPRGWARAGGTGSRPRATGAAGAAAVLLSAWQRRRRAAPAAGPHDLHTGCAGPAPRPAVLELVTRPVATEDELTDAVHAADATARPGRWAVAEK